MKRISSRWLCIKDIRRDPLMSPNTHRLINSSVVIRRRHWLRLTHSRLKERPSDHLCSICAPNLGVYTLQMSIASPLPPVDATYWLVLHCCPKLRTKLPFSADRAGNSLHEQEAHSYRTDSMRYGNGHSRSLKVIRCYANRRGIYDFLLALNSNLTSIFNRSWDITPSLKSFIHTPPRLSSRWNRKKTAGSRWTFRVHARIIRLSNHKLKSALKCTVWSQYNHCNARPSHTDRQTDGRTDERTS